ncbi:PHP domain-containing protein [Curtobacterium sp. MCLR17_007]|uniref:PHP domain-containing protein n=1 Tax=Curtobacterium sp. MCLR17_007 TaxID=2175648 RepID=UPI0021AD44BC|nr:PHP domain-containing protein [Curtobacterium sp. MCLR17_007]WIB59374.1 PHP domain-containing protein [Curtobacterium sp. MCLR17_007]
MRVNRTAHRGSVGTMTLPADAHVHSQFSWDAGSDPGSVDLMRRTCARAVRIGLPALVFTEHLDLEDAWCVDDGDLGDHASKYIGSDGMVRLPPFDLDGYLDQIDRCRQSFPELRIFTGLEFGQPHLWESAASAVLASGAIDRVNGSLHMLPRSDGLRAEPVTLYRQQPAAEVMRSYLDEVPRMVAGSSAFAVFTHIDYAVRSWPSDTEGPFDPRAFEDGFRSAMRAIAGSGRALEMNTRRLWSWIPEWWAQEGGRAVTFGSDAHAPGSLAHAFPEAVAMLEHFGFRPGRRPEDPWTR